MTSEKLAEADLFMKCDVSLYKMTLFTAVSLFFSSLMILMEISIWMYMPIVYFMHFFPHQLQWSYKEHTSQQCHLSGTEILFYFLYFPSLKHFLKLFRNLDLILILYIWLRTLNFFGKLFLSNNPISSFVMELETFTFSEV